MWAGVLVVYWGKLSKPEWINHWGAIFLFWGITFVLDGLTYRRSGGKSLIADYPSEVIGIGVVSIPGWMIFEYLNLYIQVDWYYPAGDLIPDTQFFLYALLGSSGLLPMAFVLYSFLCTFKGFKRRYAYGPKISINRGMKFVLLMASLLFLVLSGIWDERLFIMLWLAPLGLLSLALIELDIWTPFRPIKEKGDWSALMVFGLCYLFVGFLVEGQNYFSGYHLPGDQVDTFNVDYWKYCIPYVDKFHVFEMPLLGFLGYIPFSIYCWIVWIIFARFLNIKALFFNDPYPVR
jgi:hypothetical protein